MRVEITRINNETEIIECDKINFVDRPESKTSLVEVWMYNGKLQHLILKTFKILDEYYYDEKSRTYCDKKLLDKREDL